MPLYSLRRVNSMTSSRKQGNRFFPVLERLDEKKKHATEEIAEHPTGMLTLSHTPWTTTVFGQGGGTLALDISYPPIAFTGIPGAPILGRNILSRIYGRLTIPLSLRQEMESISFAGLTAKARASLTILMRLTFRSPRSMPPT